MADTSQEPKRVNVEDPSAAAYWARRFQVRSRTSSRPCAQGATTRRRWPRASASRGPTRPAGSSRHAQSPLTHRSPHSADAGVINACCGDVLRHGRQAEVRARANRARRAPADPMFEPDTLTPVGEAGPALPDSCADTSAASCGRPTTRRPPRCPSVSPSCCWPGWAKRWGARAASRRTTRRPSAPGCLPACRHSAASPCRWPGSPPPPTTLVQDALLRAWRGRGGFEPGTNLEAWLFTILRNVFYSRHRRQTREVPDSDGDYAGRLATAPEQGGHLDFRTSAPPSTGSPG